MALTKYLDELSVNDSEDKWIKFPYEPFGFKN